MKRKLLIVMLAVLSVFTVNMVSAKDTSNIGKDGKYVYGPYETNKFWDNWFVEAGLGTSMYLGWLNDNTNGRFRPAFEVGFGKWFTPSVGARVSFDYTPYATEFSNKGLITEYSVSKNRMEFNFWNLHADFLWNLSNAVAGYKERVYYAIPYIGVGLARTGNDKLAGSPDKHEFTINAGFINKFRVSKRIDINLEFRTAFAETRLDYNPNYYKGRFDMPFATIVGVTFKLGSKEGFVRANNGVSDAALAEAKAQFQKEMDAAKAKQAALEKELSDLKAVPVPVPAPVVVEKTVVVNNAENIVTLFFPLGKSTLGSKDLANLEIFAESVKSTIKDNKDINIMVVGSADKGTGTKEINQRLSEQRCEYVKNILVTKYGFDAARICTKAEGDANNRYNMPELNRSAMLYLK